MDSRDAMLAAVRQYLAQAGDNVADSMILTDAAMRDAVRLSALIDPAADLAAAFELAAFHWFRYLSLPEGEDRDDLAMAIPLFSLLFDDFPQAVPESLQRFFQDIRARTGVLDAGPDALSRGSDLFLSYQSTRALSTLWKAAGLFSAGAAATPASLPNRAAALSNLGNALQTLYEATGDADVLAEAVRVGRRAVVDAGLDHSLRAVLLTNLVSTLQASHAQTGNVAELVEALEVSRAAVTAALPEQSFRADSLNALSSIAREVFEASGNSVVLAEAVQAGREAVAVDPASAMYRNTLARSLYALFESAGDTSALTEAVRAARDAVRLTPAEQPQRAVYLRDLARVLRAQYEGSGNAGLLVEAEQASREAASDVRQASTRPFPV
jgi:hypothetical protein